MKKNLSKIIIALGILIFISNTAWSQTMQLTYNLCIGENRTLKGPAGETGYSWYKDGVLISSEQNLIVADNGQYFLTTTSLGGCVSPESDHFSFKFWAIPSAPLVSGETKACLNSSVRLTAVSSTPENDLLGYEWYKNGETVPFYKGQDLSYTITKDERIQVKAVSTTASCGSPLTSIDLKMLSPVGDFSADIKTVEFGKAVKFTSTLKNSSRWEWTFGDGFVSNQENPIHYYYKEGIMSVVLKGYSAEGCLLQVTKSNYITVTPESGPIVTIPVVNPIIIDPNPFVFKVYPNPVSSAMNIKLFSAQPQTVVIEYLSMYGSLIYRYNESLVAGNNTIICKGIEKLQANASYIIRVRMKNKTETFKIYKSN